MSSRRPASVTCAFSLIEVLVSLAIFGLAAVVLGATYVNVLTSYDAVSRRQEHEQDLRFLRITILGEPDRKLAEEGGDVTLPDNRTAHWEAKIEEGEVADLFRVTLHLEIRDPDRAQPWVQDETFMLVRPTWSDPAVRDKLRQATRERFEKRASQ